ncbi:GMC family oxidoreductase [Mesorhizobium kowhaii]|nr:GMC family oxidoreductase [Mesorhizobium kowhaii]
MNREPDTCDYLIIGGGSSGCALASRLSEDSANRVILVEAGQDVDGASEPEAVRDARFRTLNDPRFLWPNLTAAYTRDGPSGLPFGQARILGGGSSVNGMHAQRGLPADYDEWAQLGIRGWAWEDVLPFFKRLETDADFSGEQHGEEGPVHLYRVPRGKWSGLTKSIASSFERRGIHYIPDLNGQDGDGYGSVPINSVGADRISSARAYLPATVRARSNLKIVTGTTASQLILSDGHVFGAVFGEGEEAKEIRAHQTVLCCGALHTPALMLRSGIGPGDQLTQAGISVRHSLRGVGSNLINHPMLILAAHLKPQGRQQPGVLSPCPAIMRYSSMFPGVPRTDMVLNVWERTPNTLSWDPLGRQIANVMVIINKVFSAGQVALRSDRTLDVSFNLLGDHRDKERMVESVHLLADLLDQAKSDGVVDAAFFPAMTPLAALLMQDNWKAQMLSVAGAAAFSGPEPIRKRALAVAGTRLDVVMADQRKLVETVVQSALPGGHVAGTCRMGHPEHPASVTDSNGRVLGIQGLSVADTSIFPTLMAGGTNLPVIMAAEKIAATLRSEARA